jgi:hypothetical protein
VPASHHSQLAVKRGRALRTERETKHCKHTTPPRQTPGRGERRQSGPTRLRTETQSNKLMDTMQTRITMQGRAGKRAAPGSAETSIQAEQAVGGLHRDNANTAPRRLAARLAILTREQKGELDEQNMRFLNNQSHWQHEKHGRSNDACIYTPGTVTLKRTNYGAAAVL